MEANRLKMSEHYNNINYKADAKENKLEKLFAEFFAFNKNIPTNLQLRGNLLLTFMKLPMKWW